ncbi:MAG TPA: anti-sigma factor [Ktedonobacteraceae bacterium]|nr:anti-sigma factor [Ktedonobacteraceae bacterium]
MTCKEFEELSGAFALNAITPEERRAAEAHLAECAACTQLYHELRAVVDLLPLSVTQISPSPEMKERVLAAIREESKHGNERSESVPVPLAPRPRRQPGPSRWQRWGMPLVAAAAVLMFVLFGTMMVWNITLQHQLGSVQNQLIAIQHSQLASSAQVTDVQGSGTALRATGELIYYPQQNLTVLVMHNLPQLRGTHVYQGWLLRGNQPTSIGLLNTNNGSAMISFPGNAKGQGYDTTAVSVEPGPAASQGSPHGQVVAVGSLKQSSSS